MMGGLCRNDLGVIGSDLGIFGYDLVMVVDGYPKETMAYYFYYPPENIIFVAREHHVEVEHGNVEPSSDIVFIHRSARIPQAPDRYGFYVDAEEHELGDYNEPANYKFALSDLEFEKWLEAMNAKMQSLKYNQVWCLVDLPPDGKTVGSKWLFKKKTDMDGNVHTFKARLMEKVYTQTYRVDYEETFSPVVVIKRLLDDLRVTAAKLMLLVYKLLLLVLKVNAASTKEVIENGATLPKTQLVEGVMTVMPITSAKDKAHRRLEVKARTIKKRFSRNEATKKTQRNLLKQQYENFTAPSLAMLDQTFDRLKKLMSPTIITKDWQAAKNQDNKKESSRRSGAYGHIYFHNSFVSCEVLVDMTRSDQGNPQIDLQDKGVIDNGMLKANEPGTYNLVYQNTLTKWSCLRQFSVTRTPQQNEVAERRNRTLIEAARTMLADFKLPTTFLAEAVNTACYVQNRVLVVKPHNKTTYELFHGRTLVLSFMRPFGCPVTILNTIDHLGKFDGKADEGFFIRYSLNSKAFRVFNSRTRIVEENLHRFSKSTPNAVGSGPDWLIDIDALTRTINYEPIVAGTQSNGFAGTKASDNADSKSSHDDGSKPSSDDEKKFDEVPRKESECNDQEKEDNVNNTNIVNAAGINEVNAVGEKTSIELPFYPNMPALEDYSIFNLSRDDEDDGAEADMNNLDTTIQVSPILTTRIHKDHPFDQVIGDLQSVTQTRKMSQDLKEHVFISNIQQRTNHKDLQNCLFACFLSYEEPKKVIHALKDISWIEAMQKLLLQFKLQEVWTLVDLPNGKRAIGTK
ncbi:putative ribonuclease H-like domain-containing protein [Tanacetum coccineum]|uniref:Ribonuclease H-like domain-containing protein n=1 Tax=Tanacetum coccineum TaxID=301880 RepID=A0ABQ5GLS3_9ASTR